ncbi:hypothetical protein GH714_001682 [Hevea brasiliensis]|uniref:Uncharacterized protein n=1 Tax=Hevea brasiliensis TaxID=3981 RepID=A0A6A6KM58_HEVBR|nr:hypothetical protein GH714_001682 [Hevea brasiliensis]
MLDLTPVLEASANFNFRFQKSMSKLLRTVMEGHDANGFSLERWRLSVKTVVIPKGLDITDEHLLYIAKRTPNLEDLVLEGTYKITEKGFADAICFMTANIRLGEMEIGSGRFGELKEVNKGKPDQVSYVQKKFMQWRNESPGLYFDIELNDENALLDDDDFIVL